MGSISLSRTALISIIVQALFFGVFFILFGYAQWISLLKRNSRPLNKPLEFASVAMFFLAVAHLAVDSQRVMDAFLTSRQDSGGPSMFLANLAEPTFIIKSAIYILQTLIGDTCIIHRCFIIWSRSYRVIAVPLLLLVCCAGSSSVLIYSFAEAHATSTIFVLAPWATAYLVASLSTNVICTTLIAFRIWHVTVNSYLVQDGPQSLFSILAVIIESGAIYAASLVAIMVAYLAQSWGHFIVLDSLTSIIGIVFTMIIIRLHSSLQYIGQGNGLQSPSSPNSLKFAQQNRDHDQNIKPLSVQVPTLSTVFTTV